MKILWLILECCSICMCHWMKNELGRSGSFNFISGEAASAGLFCRRLSLDVFSRPLCVCVRPIESHQTHKSSSRLGCSSERISAPKKWTLPVERKNYLFPLTESFETFPADKRLTTDETNTLFSFHIFFEEIADLLKSPIINDLTVWCVRYLSTVLLLTDISAVLYS